MVRALPPARPAAGNRGQPQAGGGNGFRSAGECPRRRRCRGGVRTLPRSLFGPTGQEFQTRGADATLPPAIRAARPARRGAGEGRGAEQIPRRFPIPPRQRGSRRVPAGRWRAGLRGCAGSHRPARALFTGELRRAHMEVTAPTPISRERPAAAVQTARRGEHGGARRARGTATPPPAARSGRPSAPREACGGRGRRAPRSGGWRLHGGTRGAEGPVLAGPQHPWATGASASRDIKLR